MINLRTTTPADYSQFVTVLTLAGLTPSPDLIQFYHDHPAITTYVAEDDGEVVGTGAAANYGNRTGWIGVLAVLPRHQGRGIGSSLLTWGESHMREKGIDRFILTATPAGRPLYEKRGYAAGSQYVPFAGRGLDSPAMCGVRLGRIAPSDWESVETLDFAATGELRGTMLRAMEPGFVTRDPAGHVNGFYLPAPWGGGPLIAADPAAGRALLLQARVLHGGYPMIVRVPGTNQAAIAELQDLGFQERSGCTFMVKGAWPEPYRPDWIWGMFSFALG